MAAATVHARAAHEVLCLAQTLDRPDVEAPIAVGAAHTLLWHRLPRTQPHAAPAEAGAAACVRIGLTRCAPDGSAQERYEGVVEQPHGAETVCAALAEAGRGDALVEAEDVSIGWACGGRRVWGMEQQ